MARTISLTYEGQASHFSFSKLDRKKLYPTRRREPLDNEGRKCSRGELLSDGQTVIGSGMTGQGYFDEGGEWVPSKSLVGINPDGTRAKLVPSTLGEPQNVEPATPDELLCVVAANVYMLEPVELSDALRAAVDDGTIFRFPFNSRADYHEETGYLLKNDEGYFAIFGKPLEHGWVELENYAELTPEDEDDENEDGDSDGDLDFDMV